MVKHTTMTMDWLKNVFVAASLVTLAITGQVASAESNAESNAESSAEEKVKAAPASTAPAAATASTETTATKKHTPNDQPLADQVESLKKRVVALNRDLFILEEDLLYPEETQLMVFVSMNTGTYFQLDSVKLTLNNADVTHYLYTDRQVNALHRGGVQRLYTANLKQGEHELIAVFIGKGPNGRDFKRAQVIEFEKDDEARFIELKIVDNAATTEPEFIIKQW